MASKIILINLPLLLLASLINPAHAATQPSALELEQQRFLNSQNDKELQREQDEFLHPNHSRELQREQERFLHPGSDSELQREQDRFLKGFKAQPEPQRQTPVIPRWERSTARYQGLPERELQPAGTPVAIVPVAQPVVNPNPDPAPSVLVEPQDPPTRFSFTQVKKLPSLTTPEGYRRVTPLRATPTAQPTQTALSVPVNPPAPPAVVEPTSTPPKIAFALPPSLDSFLYRIQLGAERLLYPLVHPVEITSVFGWRTHPIFGGARFHAGIDLGAPLGSPVLAAFSGQVVSADWMGGYGLAVLIQHGAGLRSLYAHLSESLVRPGQVVMQGTVIGLSGSTGNSTGPHLHFETRRLTSGEWVAVDTGAELKAAQQQLALALQNLRQRQASVPAR